MQTTAKVLHVLSSRQEGVDPPTFLAVGYHKPRKLITFRRRGGHLLLLPLRDAGMLLLSDSV